MDPNFVHDPNLRIKFLRGERFDTKLAANKLMKHFQVKQKLFGKSKLVKNITQSDLNQEDLDMLYSGITQMLPTKDNAGRVIITCFPSSVAKTMAYMSSVRERERDLINFSILKSFWPCFQTNRNHFFFVSFPILSVIIFHRCVLSSI